jgi:hypothetical protein
VPEQHGEQARHAEHQRKGEKVPLLAKKIYVCVTKKFHAVPQIVVGRSSLVKDFEAIVLAAETGSPRPTINDERPTIVFLNA